jgi:hypothetical protein
MRKNQTRAIFSIDRSVWIKLKKIRKNYHLPINTYSAVVNQSLSTLLVVLEGAKSMKGKSEAEQRAEFYKIMSQIMSDQVQTSLML